MSPAQEEFFDRCPAWARKEGIESLAEWQIVEALMPYDWTKRYDELGRLKASIEQVLMFWDAMGEYSNDD